MRMVEVLTESVVARDFAAVVYRINSQSRSLLYHRVCNKPESEAGNSYSRSKHNVIIRSHAQITKADTQSHTAIPISTRNKEISICRFLLFSITSNPSCHRRNGKRNA